LEDRHHVAIPLNMQNDIKDDREQLAQKCHEKDKQIAFMIEEKSLLQQEIHKLQRFVDKYEHPATIGDDGASLGERKNWKTSTASSTQKCKRLSGLSSTCK
jgi:HOOK protein coiled-coil region